MQHPPRPTLGPLVRPLFTLGLYVSGCGGTPAPASPSDDMAREEAPSADADPLPASDDPLGPPLEKPATSATGRCEEGQCFTCGDAICPESFYCDEALGSCAWLPECTGRNSTCECLSKTLSDCSCREESGHLVVSCSR